MSDFDIAVRFVLLNEGELSENPNDSGGITNFGISLRYLREIPGERLRKYGIFEPIDEDTIRHLTVDQVKLIYKEEFWEGNNFDQIESQNLCNYIFDMVVAHGIAPAIRLLQRGICAEALSRNYLRDDGIMGIDTISRINIIGDYLLGTLVGIRGEFYRHVASHRPKDDVNLDRWLNRCYDVFKSLP